VPPPFNLFFRLTGRVTDLDDTTPDQPEHPNLVLILESNGDFARMDRPVAVSGESDMDTFRLGARAVATSLRLLEGYH
jgi:hypothetical protein